MSNTCRVPGALVPGADTRCDLLNYLVVVYVVGVAIGLAVMRDRWPARVATALVWPLGPMAFIAVIFILLVTAAILWPVPVLGTAALLGALVTWLT